MKDLIQKQPSSNEELRLISYCPLCEMRLKTVNAELIGERAQKRLLHVSCKKCSVSVLFLVFPSAVGQSSIGIITELNAKEVSSTHSAVSINDVIDVHLLLAGSELESKLSIDKAAFVGQNAQHSA